METPQQQAISANASTIAQHQEAIRLAKQATWEIIARQKAEAQAASQMLRQTIEEQRTTTQQNEEITDSSSKESQGSVSPMQGDEIKGDETKNDPQGLETVVRGISMLPSLKGAISQLHSDATLIHQKMQADIFQTAQKQFGVATANDFVGEVNKRKIFANSNREQTSIRS